MLCIRLVLSGHYKAFLWNENEKQWKKDEAMGIHVAVEVSFFGFWRRAVTEVGCNAGIGNFSHSRRYSRPPRRSIYLYLPRTRCVLHTSLLFFSLLKIPV